MRLWPWTDRYFSWSEKTSLLCNGLVADLTDSRICKTDSLSGRQIYNADRVRQAPVWLQIRQSKGLSFSLTAGHPSIAGCPPPLNTAMTSQREPDAVNLRLILVSGKTQDFIFSPNDSATDIAHYVFENWPAGWEEERVSSPNILRLIFQGRFLHGNVTLEALKLPPGRTTVMHLVARETLPEPNSHGQRNREKTTESSCCLLLWNTKNPSSSPPFIPLFSCLLTNPWCILDDHRRAPGRVWLGFHSVFCFV